MSLDALTPLVKHHIFRFRKIFVVVLFITILLIGLAAQHVIFILAVKGLGNRVTFDVTLSSTHRFQLHTTSVLIGRMETTSLWCPRQMYALLAHDEDELNLIRRLVEYNSPYASFPCKYNRHIPAIDDEEEIRR